MIERVEIRAEEVRVGDYLPGVEWDAGEYREADGPNLEVVAVEITPENHWEGDKSLIVEVRTRPAPHPHLEEITYYSGEKVAVYREVSR